MTPRPLQVTEDPWYEWLLYLRHANDPLEHQAICEETDRYASRVVSGAFLAPGMTLVDVGTGDGLIALKAIAQIGASLNVILTDISTPLLEHAQANASRLGVETQCAFLERNAQALHGIQDASVDAVTTRAVLAYVPDKVAALQEFHRILKPGGRISLGEPVMLDEARATCALKNAVDSSFGENADQFLVLLHRWKSAQFPDTVEKILSCPMTDYSERDLVRYAQRCGFREVHLELHIDIRPFKVSSWDTFLNSSPHPLAPTLRFILDNDFTALERSYFEKILYPIIVTGDHFFEEKLAYLTAIK